MSKKTSKIQMDARKFLRAINTSAQGRIAFFNEAVQKLGEEDGSSYRLTALGTANLIYEDVDTNQYYVADIGRLGKSNRFKIHNVREIEITESEKPKLFGKNCLDLVESICEDNHKEAQRVWNLLHRQRFRGCVIPESGMVTSKDGVAHRITTKSASNLDLTGLADAIAHNLTDQVDLHEGQIYCGVFSESGEDVVLPVTELTVKKTIARQLKQVAQEAFQSESFQRLVKSIAGRVAKNQLPEAVETAAKFLNEEQEFSSLTYDEFKTLVEDTLATQLVLNPFIAEDTAKLMYQTNIRVNRQSILEAWRNAALQTSSSEFLYNVETLSEAKDFGAAYSQFLENLLNEDENHYAPEENRRWAYVNFLKHTAEQLDANKTKEPGKDTSDREALVDRVLELSRELENEDSGHDVLLRADQMFAELREKLGDVIDTLYDYDTDPEEADGMDELSPEGDMMQLPEVGAPGGGGGMGGLGGGLGGLDADLGGGDDLGLGGGGDLGLGGGEDLDLGGLGGEVGGDEAGGLDLAAGLPESKNRDFTPVENMSVSELTKEYETWYTDGQVWLESHGFDECFTEMQRLIRRCTEIGEPAAQLREAFEDMRDVMVAEGNDILRESKDTYSSTVDGFDLDDLDIDFSSYQPSLEEALSGKGTRMDDLQGEGGVQTEKPKSVDGRKGHKSAGAGGPEGEAGVDASKQGEQGIDPSSGGKIAGKGSRMDDLQGSDGVQTEKPKPDGTKSGGHGTMSEGEMPFCPKCRKKKESCECGGDGGDGEDIQDDQYRDATDAYGDAGPDAGERKRFAVKEGKCRCANDCKCDGDCRCEDGCRCAMNEDAMVAISTDEPLSGMGDLIDKMIDKMREGGDLPDEMDNELEFDEPEMGGEMGKLTVIDDEHTDDGVEVEDEPDADEDDGVEVEDDDDADGEDEDFRERIERELDSVEEAKHEGVMGKDTGTSMSKDHQNGKGVADKGGKLKDKGHSMDEFQDGKGVADGRGSLKDKGSRMDDLQGSGGVQKKGVTSESKNRRSRKSRKRGRKRRR